MRLHVGWSWLVSGVLLVLLVCVFPAAIVAPVQAQYCVTCLREPNVTTLDTELQAYKVPAAPMCLCVCACLCVCMSLCPFFVRVCVCCVCVCVCTCVCVCVCVLHLSSMMHSSPSLDALLSCPFAFHFPSFVHSFHNSLSPFLVDPLHLFLSTFFFLLFFFHSFPSLLSCSLLCPLCRLLSPHDLACGNGVPGDVYVSVSV